MILFACKFKKKKARLQKSFSKRAYFFNKTLL